MSVYQYTKKMTFRSQGQTFFYEVLPEVSREEIPVVPWEILTKGLPSDTKTTHVIPSRKRPSVLTREWLSVELMRCYSRDSRSRLFRESESFRYGLEDCVSVNTERMLVVFTESGHLVGKIAWAPVGPSNTNVMYVYGSGDFHLHMETDRRPSALSVIWHAVSIISLSLHGPDATLTVVMPRDTIYKRLLQSSCKFVELEGGRMESLSRAEVLAESDEQALNIDTWLRGYMQRMLDGENDNEEDFYFGAKFVTMNLFRQTF